MMRLGGRVLSAMIPLPFISISRLLRAADGTVLLGPMSLRPHNSANRHVLVLIVHEYLALGLNHKIAAGQHSHNLRGHARLECRA